MLIPTLLAACFFGAATIPGASVDSPADDRQLFRKLELSVIALAESESGAVRRDARLEQCKRPHTDVLKLPSGRADDAVLLDGPTVYRRAASAAVLIGTAYKCDKCTKWHHTLASGFAVTADGVIATNHHVAASATAEAMGVMTTDGRFFPVLEVLAANQSHDVALLRTDAKDLSFLPLRDDAPAGSPIRCYSHPANSFGCLSEGIIARYARLHEAERKGAVFMQITADYARGSSGGPVIDAYGHVVGMVASTSPVFTAPTTASASAAKDSKPATPSQQMVRHNCATARAILELTRPR